MFLPVTWPTHRSSYPRPVIVNLLPMPQSDGPAAPREASPYAHHIPSLDGIRGLAILLVLFGHLFPSSSYSPNPFVQAVLSLRAVTWVGVNLFFALSGFLITGILVDTLHNPHYFRSFFGRRALRIFPLYYGVLIVLLVLTPFFPMHWNGSQYLFLTYTQNLPFIINPKGPAPWAVLSHFWSLAVEEQFYLVWPVILYWLRAPRRIMLATIVGAAIALGLRTALALAHGFPQNHATPFCMDALLAGAALALLVRSRYHDAALRFGLPLFAAAAVLIGVPALRSANFDWESSFYLTTIGLTIVNLGAAGLIAASLRPRSLIRSLFSGPVLRFFGKYSYGLYVFHYSADAILAGRLHSFFQSHGMGKGSVVVATGIMTTAASVLIALISYHAYEQPFLRLKRRFAYDRPLAAKA